MALSEYEQKRLENIRRNQELLNSLQVPKAVEQTAELRKTRSGSTIKKHTPKRPVKKQPIPQRVSARLRGLAAENIEVDENGQVQNNDGIEWEKRNRPAEKRINKLNEADQAKFLKILGNIKQESSHADNDEDDSDDIKVDPSLSGLKEQLDNLRIRHSWATVKMTNDKISHCLFHPNQTKLLAVAASSVGYLSFWDIDNKEEETGDPVVYTYRPSTRGITNAKFCLEDPKTLYLSSYDGTLQTFDMNTAAFGNVGLASDYSLTGFDLTQNGQVIYFSTSAGEVGVKDLRSKDIECVVALREKKIGCLHLNPVHTNLLVAASNDRTATIWDVRNLPKASASTCLQELQHGFAVTSAYWSPSGEQLATSCYDDYLRVYDLNQSKDQVGLKGKIPHNCHTGKWVTMFRTRWNENKRFGLDHPHFVVGNMKHPSSIFSGETVSKIADLYDEERITAIPAVNEFHPTLDSLALISANASGRVVCWT